LIFSAASIASLGNCLRSSMLMRPLASMKGSRLHRCCVGTDDPKERTTYYTRH
jgi:hypothetical protein